MSTNFTEKQREVVARKMGYDGPMQMFDEYLASSPSDATRFAGITSKVAAKMAKGGLVKKMANGGAVTDADVLAAYKANPLAEANPTQASIDYWKDKGLSTFNQEVADVRAAAPAFATAIDTARASPTPATGLTDADVLSAYYSNPAAEKNPTQTSIDYWKDKGLSTFNQEVADVNTATKTAADNAAVEAAAKTAADNAASVAAANAAGTKSPPLVTSNTFASPTGEGPALPSLTTATAQQAQAPAAIVPVDQAATTIGAVTSAQSAAPVAAPTTIAAPTITPDAAQTKVQTELEKLQAAQGVVSAPALAQAAQQAPTTTALAGMQAAQGIAGTVAAPVERQVGAGELVSGTAVDQAKVEATLAQTQAAQGVVTEDMTTQGQLNKMLANFDAGNPPPWAAGTMRTAMATLSARGLGASSMAGQAIVQAALEAAAPIAQADAKVFETMGLTNLSNRQQTAILLGQQRAAFLGQEFDQTFQTKVLNAAKISDIANRNFDASVTIALENARITSSMDIANLSASNAMVLATAAQTANLETANLNNRQQVAVQNAQAFLTMDVKNLDNNQQTALFKSQQLATTILSDTAAANAAKATNATNQIEVDRINETLALTASQFNAAEVNKVNIVNANAANELSKFNATEANNRAEFNANNATTINVANAKILADISTANTISANSLAAVNAKNATDLSATVYAQQSTTYRDLLQMSVTAGENEKNRLTNLAIATITANATTANANITADAESSGQIGTALMKGAEILSKTEVGESAINATLKFLGF